MLKATDRHYDLIATIKSEHVSGESEEGSLSSHYPEAVLSTPCCRWVRVEVDNPQAPFPSAPMHYVESAIQVHLH